MYNAEIKGVYINEFTESASRKNAARALFEATQKYEEAWGVDIGCIDVDSLMKVLPDLLGARTKSQKTRLSILKLYAEWCISHGIEGANPEIIKIVLPEDFGLEKVRRQMVANPQHLQTYLNVLCNPVDKQMIDVTTRAYFWLAFAGVEEEDSVKVTGLDVNLFTMTIDYCGECYPIYREAAPAISMCATCTWFNSDHPRRTKPQPRASGDTLLRGFKEKTVMVFRSNVGRFIKSKQENLAMEGIDLNVTYYRVWLSGIFYRAYERERFFGEKPSFMSLAEKFMDGKVYHLEKSGNLRGAKQRSLAKEYRDDYERWKKAFKI